MLKFEQYKHNALYLTVDEYQQLFDNCWENMAVSFKKLELLQYYNEGADSPYNSLKSNQIKKFCVELVNHKNAEKPYYIHALSQGIQLQRLHILEFPITPYIEYEYYSYFITSALGEQIKYLDKQFLKENLSDFLIFDEQYAFILDYDINGVLNGAWSLTEKDLIKELKASYDQLFYFSNTHDFHEILVPNKQILEGIL